MKTVTKPWGKEEWLELNDKYCYKRIYINAGYKTSYQYHDFKRETNYIISGEAEIWLENDDGVVEKKIMKAGEYFNVTPPKKHRVIALTDIILQEVSTPEVHDVIRLEDDTNRVDGYIDGEHQNPAVLILAAGLGTRLNNLNDELNKSLFPINNRAVLSHIIDKFPRDFDFVIAIGYRGDLIREYCKQSHPNHNFIFVEVDGIEDEKSGPGYSALQCEKLLNRPFYISTCDCLISSELPKLDGNWLGVYPTVYPEKYSTVNISDSDDIIEFKNKCEDGFTNAFIGLAGIRDYGIFWNELNKNMINGELVSAFKNPTLYPVFKTKEIEWFDTGNQDDLFAARRYFNDTPLSLEKNTKEVSYKEGNRFIKFIPNSSHLENNTNRAKVLKDKIPNNFKSSSKFISYDWTDGSTLYSLDDLKLYKNFLKTITNLTEHNSDNKLYIEKFYITKTEDRKNLFTSKYSTKFENESYNINGVQYPSLLEIMSKIDYSILNTNPFYTNFHGDLQFDNIIHDGVLDKYTYIDWRESFAGNTESGDIYYDLAKLYGGCIIPYDKMKDDNNIQLTRGVSTISYSYQVSDNLTKFKAYYENWLVEQGYDLEKIKLITALIFLNMSPLHTEKFSMMLWFKSIELLHEYTNK